MVVITSNNQQKRKRQREREKQMELVPPDPDGAVSTSPGGTVLSPKDILFPPASTIIVEQADYETPFLPEMPFGKRFVFMLFEHPTTVVSKYISIFVFFLILLSSVSGFVESIPGFRYPNLSLKDEDDSSPTFKAINDYCMILFVIEYMSRLTTAHACFLVEDMELDKNQYLQYEDTAGGCYRTWAWFKQPLSLIDFFAVLPFAFQVIPGAQELVSGSVALRYFRLIRVFRVMKLQKQTISVSLFLNTIVKSAGPLSVLIFFLAMCIVVFGSICFNIERGNWIPYNADHPDAGGCPNGADGSAYCCGPHEDPKLGGCWMRNDFFGDGLERSPFTSVFMSMWWVLTTVTTVGYGDMFPTSTMGRLIGSLAMVMGVIGFAMPITIIGTTFSEEYEALTSGPDSTGGGLLDFFIPEPDFQKYDTNNSGAIDLHEFQLALRDKFEWTKDYAEAVFIQILKTDGANVGVQEFSKLCSLLKSIKDVFKERFEDLDLDLVVQLLEPAGLLALTKEQQNAKNFGPITIITDDQAGKRVAPSSNKEDYMNAAPTPAPMLEAPTPSRFHDEESIVAYSDNYTHLRPPDYQTPLDLSSQSARQLSTLQLLISQELCRRLQC